MPSLEKTLYVLFPTLRLRGTPWFGLWVQRDRQSILLTTRVACATATLAYLAHLLLIDRPLGLLSDTRWIWYRLGMSALALVFLLLTFGDGLRTSARYRWPLSIFCIRCTRHVWRRDELGPMMAG